MAIPVGSRWLNGQAAWAWLGTGLQSTWPPGSFQRVSSQWKLALAPSPLEARPWRALERLLQMACRHCAAFLLRPLSTHRGCPEPGAEGGPPTAPLFPALHHACRPTRDTGSAWGPRMLTSSPALKGKTGKLRSFKPTGAFNKTSLTSLCPAGNRRGVREDRGWPPPSICQSPPASWAKTPLLTEELTASRAARPRCSQPHGTGRPLSNPRGSVLSTQHVHTELRLHLPSSKPGSSCQRVVPAEPRCESVLSSIPPSAHSFIHPSLCASISPPEK